MSAYIKLSTLEYPRYEGDIRREHPEIQEDQTGEAFSCPSTYAPVEITDPPTFDSKTQTVVEITPVQVEGKWVSQWQIVDLAPEIVARFEELESGARSVPLSTDVNLETASSGEITIEDATKDVTVFDPEVPVEITPINP